jgi:hypothetical protein
MDSESVSRGQIRDDIFDRARIGELNPEEAEATAAEAAVGPLAKRPSPNNFDPMAEPHWTLAMALAWAIWRTPEKAREYWNDYRLQFSDWKPHNWLLPDRREKGWHLESREAVDLHDVWRAKAQRHADEGLPLATIELNRLWGKLQTGAITASGRPHRPSGQARCLIPKIAWIDLSKINFFEGNPESVGLAAGNEPLYDDVRIERDRVLAIWPAVPGRIGATAREESECRRNLVEMMQANPEKPRLKGEVRCEYPKIGKNAFNRAWSDAVRESRALNWSAPGKRPRST